MPIGPNFNGSGASIMQYTYLPRLLATGGASTRRSGGSIFAARAGRAADLRVAEPLPRPVPFADRGLGIDFTGGSARLPRRLVLGDGFGMFCAPAGLFPLHRGWRVEHFPDFPDQVL